MERLSFWVGVLFFSIDLGILYLMAKKIVKKAYSKEQIEKIKLLDQKNSQIYQQKLEDNTNEQIETKIEEKTEEKQVQSTNEGVGYIKYFILKYVIFFAVIYLVVAVFKLHILYFILGAVCALMLGSFFIFLVNKNN